MLYMNKWDVALVVFLFQGLKFSKGAVTLTYIPVDGTIGDDVVLTCTNTAGINDVSWKINGGSEQKFDRTQTKRVINSVFRDFAVTTSTTEYRLAFKTYRFDEGSTWQCLDDGLSSSVVTLFFKESTTTATPTTTKAAGTGVSQTQTTSTTDDNIPLIAGLCAMGGLLLILLTVIACWCMGRHSEPHTKTVTVRREYVREPEQVEYVREIQPPPRTTYPEPVYEYRREPQRRTIVLANNPVYDRNSDVYDPRIINRPSLVSSSYSDVTRSGGSRNIGVVYDSYEGRESDDLYPTKDVYAKIIRRPNDLYM